MARQYLYHNGMQIPLNGQDFWVGTHQQFEEANPPIPKGTLLYFTDGELDHRESGVEIISIPSGSAYGEKSISFSKSFKTKPFVTFTCESGTGTGSNVPDAILTALDTNGFTVRVWRTTGASTSNGASPAVYWKAEEV